MSATATTTPATSATTATAKSAALDYSKFDQLARDEEETERRAKELERARNRDRYMREQEERKQKWISDKNQEKAKAKATAATAAADHKQQPHAHAHGHGHDHHHGHSHGGGAHDHAHDDHAGAGAPNGTAATSADAVTETTAEEEWAQHSSCGCGYVDPERLKKLAAERAAKPEMPLEVRNKKKLVAVEATRLDGNRLFKEGKYQEAFQIYERGVLIANGTVGLSDADQDVMNKLEVTLDLNIAACRLKQKQYLEAIDACRTVLNLDPQNVKARYRKGEAYQGMAEYAQAVTHYEDAQRTAAAGSAEAVACVKAIAECRKLEAAQQAKQKAHDKEMVERMRTHKSALSAPDVAATAPAPAPAIAPTAAPAAAPTK